MYHLAKKEINHELITYIHTYRNRPTSLRKPRTPQLSPRFLRMFRGLFGAICIAVQIHDCVVGFLAGVEG